MWLNMTGSPLPADVECSAGYRGEELPRRFGLAADTIDI
jgi:hypothetical protein